MNQFIRTGTQTVIVIKTNSRHVTHHQTTKSSITTKSKKHELWSLIEI